MSDLINVKKDINYSSLSQQVYHHIKRMIITQELKGGQRIPEEAIAKIFNVSRTPIREAIRELEKNGLVTIYPRKYAEVVKLNKEDNIYIGQMRIQLDSLSVSLLSKNITEEGYNTLTDLVKKCDVYAKQGDIGSCFEMDSAFHCTMAELTGNPYLTEIVRLLDLKVQLLRNSEALSLDHVREGIRHHQPIVEAVYAGDEEKALQLVKEHLEDYYFSSTRQ